MHENRIRQAASSLGAARSASIEAVAYARERVVFGKPLAANQAIQWPLVELHTECEMLRGLVRETAGQMDEHGRTGVSHRVSMCNYRANRLVCDAADRAIQVHGGIGYTRHWTSSTSTATTAVIASPRARRRSRSATWQVAVRVWEAVTSGRVASRQPG